MMRRFQKLTFILLVLSLGLGSSYEGWAAPARWTFQYTFADFNGPLNYGWVRLYVDKPRDEIYVLEGNLVRIFNRMAMEIYRFGDDLDLGNVYDLTVDEAGNIYTLSHVWEQGYYIVRCNYRGEPQEKIRVATLPPDFSKFVPNRMFYREGRFYLLSKAQMIGVITDKKGRFERAIDFASMIGVEEKDKEDTDVFDYAMDDEGNILFTVPVLFKVYKVSPDGSAVASFGKKGSGPGRFGVVAGIAADSRGHYFVSDTLRCVVMVFDRNMKFVTEFGYRGFRPWNLIGPRSLASDSSGNVFVTQLRKRGISVFQAPSN